MQPARHRSRGGAGDTELLSRHGVGPNGARLLCHLLCDTHGELGSEMRSGRVPQCVKQPPSDLPRHHEFRARFGDFRAQCVGRLGPLRCRLAGSESHLA
jgi:hypothetical protein